MKPIIRGRTITIHRMAGVLSILLPGLGQLYRGQNGLGIMFMVSAIFLYVTSPCTFLIGAIVGLCLHLLSIILAFVE